MSVRLQEYVDVSLEVRQGFFLGSPTASAVVNQVVGPAVAASFGALSAAAADAVHIVLQNDTLSGIASTYLGDAGTLAGDRPGQRDR